MSNILVSLCGRCILYISVPGVEAGALLGGSERKKGLSALFRYDTVCKVRAVRPKTGRPLLSAMIMWF